MEIKLYEPNELVEEKLAITINHPTKPNVKILNPLLESSILERLFLDGDIPELRYGPLHPQGKPAIPVITETLNPIVVGEMLESASELVLTTLKEQEQRLLAENNQANIMERPDVYNVQGLYTAGILVKPLKITPKPLTELAQAPLAKQREWAYKSIATTQGRVSLAEPIRELLWKDLQKEECISNGTCKTPQTFKTNWTMTTFGADDMQTGFSPALSACHAIKQEFLLSCKENRFLRDISVKPINQYADRVFGWEITITYCMEQ